MSKQSQRVARERVEKAVAGIVDCAISEAFGAGMIVAARENPHSHTGHYTRLFARAVQRRIAGYDRKGQGGASCS